MRHAGQRRWKGNGRTVRCSSIMRAAWVTPGLYQPTRLRYVSLGFLLADACSCASYSPKTGHPACRVNTWKGHRGTSKRQVAVYGLT